MAKDIRGTKAQDEFFKIVGDLANPTSHMFAELFARHKKSPPKYSVDDIIEIGPEHYPGVNPKSATTIGLYIFNKFIMESMPVFGYINKPITKDVFENLESQLAAALVAKDIKQEQVCEFLNRTQYLFGGPLAHIINPSMSYTILNLPPDAKRMKAKLVEENRERLDQNDPEASATIEKQVVKTALDSMHKTNDPALALFDSGAIDPYNNYRTMFVQKGAIADNTGMSPTGYKIVKSSYDEGVSKEDLPKIADSVVTTAYSSGVATQDSGSLGKKYNVLLQNVTIQENGSDCATKDTIDMKITSRYMYRYIVEGGKLIQLTPENIDKYKGKVCKLRSPIRCKAQNPEYCSVCMGERLYRIGVKNVGQIFNTVSGSTLNAALKKKHDVSVKLYTCSVADILKYVE